MSIDRRIFDTVIKLISYSELQIENMYRIAKYHILRHSSKQIIKTIEELSELQIELCSYLLKTTDFTNEDYEDLLKEIYDADYMIFQMKILFINDFKKKKLYDEIVNSQISRELKRRGLE